LIPVKVEVTVLPNMLERNEDMVDKEELSKEGVGEEKECIGQNADRLEGIQ